LDGHCVVLNGSKAIRVGPKRVVQDWTVVTWGALTEATHNWWRYYGREVYLVITSVLEGHDALGAIDQAQMTAALRAFAK
ncbi:MAG: hypothetical protein ACRD22_19990, partial [Terriglobia bacterium]